MKKFLFITILILFVANIFFFVKWNQAERASNRNLITIHHTWKIALYEVKQGDVNNPDEILPAAYVLQHLSYPLLNEMSQLYDIRESDIVSDDLTFIYSAIKNNNKSAIVAGINNAKELYSLIDNITDLSDYKEPLESYIRKNKEN